MRKIGLGQHGEKGVHLDMQKRPRGDLLQRLGDRAFAGAADAIQNDDARPFLHSLPPIKSVSICYGQFDFNEGITCAESTILCLTGHDLDAMRAAYAALGFTLAPRGQHPFGTGNAVIQLHGSYLELLAVARPQDVPEHGREELFLRRFQPRLSRAS